MSEEENIKKKIQEQGLSLEIEIASILEEQGWLTFQEFPYIDKDEDKIRKIDIFALSTIKDKIILLNIECKRSEKKPWVFYTKKDDIPFMNTREFDEIIKNDTHEIATNYRIPFEGKDEFLEACYQVSKSSVSNIENNIVSFPKGAGEIISVPLIVFDGTLWQFSSYKTIDLKKTEYVRYLDILPNDSKVIRVIRKDYFSKFLDYHLIK